MSSGITDNRQMMYVGELPWHGLGTKLDQLATAEEAIVAGGLDWNVVKEPVKSSKGVDMPRTFITMREDTGLPLGVVGTKYEIYQNREAFRFFDEVTMDPNGPKYCTAGSLHGGQIVWMLAKLPEVIKVTKTDLLEQYMLFTHGFDDWTPVRMHWTTVRVVCANTLAMSMNDVAQGLKFKHIGALSNRTEAARAALGLVNEAADDLKKLTKLMVQYTPTDEEVIDVLQKLFPATDEEKPTPHVKRQREDICYLYESGKGNKTKEVKRSAWALLNGITEYIDHVKVIRSRTLEVPEVRMQELLWGSAADLKQRAFSTIHDLVASKN